MAQDIETTKETTQTSEKEVLNLEPERFGVNYSTLLVCCHNLVNARVPLIASNAVFNAAPFSYPHFDFPSLSYSVIEGLFYLAPNLPLPLVLDAIAHDKALSLSLAALKHSPYALSPALAVSVIHSGTGFNLPLVVPVVLEFGSQNKSLTLTLTALQHNPHVQSPTLASALAWTPSVSYEDFTTYTKLDPNGHITVTSSRVSFSLWRNEDSTSGARVFKDKGANYFNGNFTHKFTLHSPTLGNGNGETVVYVLGNEVGDFQTWATHTLWIQITDDNTYTCYLRIINVQTSAYLTLASNTIYYVTVIRSGLTVTMNVYSDAARTVLFATRSVTDANPISARYVYVCSDEGTDTNSAVANVYVENLLLS